MYSPLTPNLYYFSGSECQVPSLSYPQVESGMCTQGRWCTENISTVEDRHGCFPTNFYGSHTIYERYQFQSMSVCESFILIHSLFTHDCMSSCDYK